MTSKLLITFFLLSMLSGLMAAPTITLKNNPFQYSAMYTDHESHLQYLNARFYDSQTARFISRDRYHLLNRYAYANGNPVMNADPSGHVSKKVIVASILNGLGVIMSEASTSLTLNRANQIGFLTAERYGLKSSIILGQTAAIFNMAALVLVWSMLLRPSDEGNMNNAENYALKIFIASSFFMSLATIPKTIQFYKSIRLEPVVD